MKIVCISDTHNFHNQLTIPDGDMLIHAGDATVYGKISEVAAFAEWFNGLPHKHKIFVAGNHDWLYEKDPYLAKTFVPNLLDNLIEIEGLKIYGSSWNPWFYDWAFNLHRGEPLAEKWALIPDEVDILVTHSPPYGIGDAVNGVGQGCEELRKVVDRIRPKVNVFGHIHEGYGTVELNGTFFVNASICDGAYQPVNEPIVIEI